MARRDREDLKNKPLSSVVMPRLPEELEELELGETAIVDGKAFMRVDVGVDNSEKKIN
ncbi:MAG: hypothetical protein ACPGR2_02785 [Psychrobium sp.]